MKKLTLLLFALLLCTAGIFAQKTKSTRSSVHTSISDDDKELSISVRGTINGKYVDFDRTYDVSNLSEKEKNKLKRSIGDSLGVNLSPTVPLPPLPPTPPLPPLPPHEIDGIGVYSENIKPSLKPHFSKGMSEIRVTCEKCPKRGTISLKSDDNKGYVTFSFQEEDKDVFPLIFKSQAGKFTFKYDFGTTSFSETLTMKKNDVILKKL